MTPTQFATALLAFGCHAACWAGGSDYGSASAAYQAQMKRDDPTLLNTGFIVDRVTSQAKRSVREATDRTDQLAAQAEAEAAAAARAATTRGARASSVNIASPHIYGTVRGNVYVISQRSRGRVTSVLP